MSDLISPTEMLALLTSDSEPRSRVLFEAAVFVFGLLTVLLVLTVVGVQ